MNPADQRLRPGSPRRRPEGTTLATLGLSTDELSALARQGFVAAESRGRSGPFFKLRFRIQGRQFVKYLGSDPLVAAQIRQQVLALQTERRLSLELNRLAKQARQVLRDTQDQLRCDLRAAGFAFHGLAIRKKSRGP